jgi:hypothetical protein
MPNKYWTPSGGISWEVIEADIGRYIDGAIVQPFEQKGKPGYLIGTLEKVEKEELTAMLADLKADTLGWQKEGGAYYDSQVHATRQYYGGSYAARQQLR